MSIRIGWHEFIAQPRRRGGRAACGARPITGAKPVIGFLYPGSPWFRGSFPHPRRGADSHSSAARLTATSDGPATSVRVLGEEGEGTPNCSHRGAYRSSAGASCSHSGPAAVVHAYRLRQSAHAMSMRKPGGVPEPKQFGNRLKFAFAEHASLSFTMVSATCALLWMTAPRA
jgi:hypothetical protein